MNSTIITATQAHLVLAMTAALSLIGVAGLFRSFGIAFIAAAIVAVLLYFAAPPVVAAYHSAQ